MKFFLRHLELVLTIVGIALIFAVTGFITPRGVSHWQVAAIVATFVGLLHGGIFWAVRRRRREVRLALIDEIQRMLKDQISNQLTVIDAMSTLRENRPEETQRARDYISRAVTSISTALDHLSEDSLRSWKAKNDGTSPAPDPKSGQ